MSVNENFYNEIFEKEKYWTELSNKNLLNIYYLNGPDGIKEFYLNKKKILEQYANNSITSEILIIINNIISEIDKMTFDYRGGTSIDINLIIPMFLYNQMNNTVKDKKREEKEKLELQKRVLESLNKTNMPINNDEYAYDYLDEEPDYKGKVA